MFGKKKRIAELERQLSDYKKWKRLFDDYDTLRLQVVTQNGLLFDIRQEIMREKDELARLKEQKQRLFDEYNEIQVELQSANAEIVADFFESNVENFLQDWNGPEETKDALDECLDWQKTWLLSKDVGRKRAIRNDFKPKQIEKMQELLRQIMGACYNMAAEKTIQRMSANGLQRTQTRLVNMSKEYDKLGKPYDIFIDPQFVMFKVQEAQLRHDYLVELEMQKEERKRQARILREQEKYLQEIEREKQRLNQQFSETKDRKEQEEIQQQIEELNQKITKTRSGWLYIISPDDGLPHTVKLGITRRLDPMVRVNELSDASHSFPYNVHGFVFAEDVFQLEKDIHEYFAHRRINQVNPKKENFFVTIDEVEEALKELGYPTTLKRNMINPDFIESIQKLDADGFDFESFGLEFLRAY